MKWIIYPAVAVGFAVGVVVMIRYLAGAYSPKVPATVAENAAEIVPSNATVVKAELVDLPLFESAVGNIGAVHKTSIGSKLLARVVEVNIKAGQKVHEGEVLIRLDDTDIKTKLEQAKATVAAAEAVRAQAATDEGRYAQLVQSRAVSRQEYDKMVTALRSADANLQRAKEAVKEVEVTMGWATIRSPIDGTVIDKSVDVGDMVTPGQLLATLYDPTRMQLVASVRESLAQQLHVGQAVDVQVEGLSKQCSGTISEKVPEAQSTSRTFQVKVTGPCPAGIYSGMFGRILIPLHPEKVLVIPRAAVRHVGQLDLVVVDENGRAVQRAIRIGRSEKNAPEWPAKWSEYVEVLAGLQPGERVVVPATASTAQEAPHE